MTLLMAMSGTVHDSECRAKGRIYKVLAPEMPEEDVREFLQVRGLVGCGTCLRAYRSEVAL